VSECVGFNVSCHSLCHQLHKVLGVSASEDTTPPRNLIPFLLGQNHIPTKLHSRSGF